MKYLSSQRKSPDIEGRKMNRLTVKRRRMNIRRERRGSSGSWKDGPVKGGSSTRLS
jgi:hypothetical protein